MCVGCCIPKLLSLASLVNLGTRFLLRGVVLSHTEIFEFQDVIKIKKTKQQFSHNFKIFLTFVFLHREFSVRENKYL